MIESGGDMQPHLPEGQASMNGFEQAADGILLGNLSDPFCRDSCCKGIGRNVVCDNTARIDNTVVTYSYARAYYDICPKPAVVSDFDRPGITEETFDPVAADHAPPFFRKHRIHRRDDRHVRPKVIIIHGRYPCIILYGKVEIHKAALTDLCVTAIVKANKPEHPCAFIDLCLLFL